MKEANIVLITGGAGFIGSHTSDALIKSGYKVRILDNLDPQIHGENQEFPDYINPAVECILGDIRNEDDIERAIDGVSIIYHFASLTGVGQSMYKINDYTETNVSGTANLLKIALDHKKDIKKIILSSSRAVYGEGNQQCPDCGQFFPTMRIKKDLDDGKFEIVCPKCHKDSFSIRTKEDSPLAPISVYGWTKKAQEELFSLASNLYQIPITILRYFNVYGSRQSLINPYTGVIAIFFSRLMEGKTISIYENNTPLRDFIHVNDIVRANIKAMDYKVEPFSIFNVGSGQKITILDLAKSLSSSMGKKLLFEITSKYRLGDIKSCIADTELAERDLAFKSQISLEKGLKEFSDWAKTQTYKDLYQNSEEELKSFGMMNN